MTRYHVAPDTYQTGDDLYSYIELWIRTGEEPEYKWQEMDKDFYTDSLDANVVCMFDTLAEAEQFQAENGGKILAIDLPDWASEEGVTLTTVDEGFAAVYHRIPATLCGETIISEVA